MILVTGGAGFIGSNFVLEWLAHEGTPVVNLDKLTYAGNLENLVPIARDTKHIFVHGDITDRALVSRLLSEHRPRAIVHLAAESHVDRSILDPAEFVETNVVGTFNLLECARRHWQTLDRKSGERFVFVHVSTDEVYGSLTPTDPRFSETTRYQPNSPYSASKAGSDHMVRSYFHTYGFPAIITNCSNNYGPRQFPEKLIPLMLMNALEGKPLPVYGDGLNVRDWLYVADHCAALRAVVARGKPGETYNIGGNAEMTNMQVVNQLCAHLDEIRPGSPHCPHKGLLQFVKDRPGHDRRYAIDCSKIARELDWRPSVDFAEGLKRTIAWYLENGAWLKKIRSGEHAKWIEKNYGTRGKA